MYDRQRFLALAGTAMLPACSPTVPTPPKRVLSAGLTEQDDLLAAGVVPVADAGPHPGLRNMFGLIP